MIDSIAIVAGLAGWLATIVVLIISTLVYRKRHDHLENRINLLKEKVDVLQNSSMESLRLVARLAKTNRDYVQMNMDRVKKPTDWTFYDMSNLSNPHITPAMIDSIRPVSEDTIKRQYLGKFIADEGEK